MSDPGLSHVPDLNPTRQQLDELDTLIHRMLGLPVNHLDEELIAIAEERRTQRPRLMDHSSVPLSLKTEMPDNQSPPTANHGSQKVDYLGPSVFEKQPVVVENQIEQAVTDSVLPAGSDAPQDARTMGGGGRGDASRPTLHAPRLTLRLAWMLPLVGVNLLFDCLTFPLGPPGRWLRGDSGRLFLGWTGLALLVAALSWGFLEWMGWLW
jgi:hypothetical protein